MRLSCGMTFGQGVGFGLFATHDRLPIKRRSKVVAIQHEITVVLIVLLIAVHVRIKWKQEVYHASRR